MSSETGTEIRDLTREQLVSLLQNEGFVANACVALFHHVVADRLGLNATDHKVLDLIKAGPVTPGQIARHFDLTSGAITLVLDRLEREGFIRREHDSADRRRIIVHADFAKIRAEVAPLLACLESSFSQLCDGYSEEELRFLIEFVRKAQACFREAAAVLDARAEF